MSDKASMADFRTITPYLIVPDIDRQIEFLENAFYAEKTVYEVGPDGSTPRHAQVKIGDSVVMMGGGSPEFGPLPGSTYLFVENIDDLHQKALDAGATEIMPPADQEYGHRSSGIKDPNGNYWWIASPMT